MHRESTALPPEWIERFWSNVDKSGSCWLWTAGKSHGYGVFAPAYRARFTAHRLAYELQIGPIPDGLVIDHICRNPTCVNPVHLEPVTQAENCRRGVGFSGINNRKTQCIAGHPLTGDNLYVDPNGRRQCKACRAAALRRFRAPEVEQNQAERAALIRRVHELHEAGMPKRQIAFKVGVARVTVYRYLALPKETA